MTGSRDYNSVNKVIHKTLGVDVGDEVDKGLVELEKETQLQVNVEKSQITQKNAVKSQDVDNPLLTQSSIETYDRIFGNRKGFDTHTSTILIIHEDEDFKSRIRR